MNIEELTSFVENEMSSAIIEQIRCHQIFTEADFQAVIYWLIKQEIMKSDSNWPDWTVTCQRGLRGGKPDILICENNVPTIVMELKSGLNPKAPNLPEQGLRADRKKLKTYAENYPHLKKCYLAAVFDTDKENTFSLVDDKSPDYDKYGEIFINVRNIPEYDDWLPVWREKHSLK